MGILHIISRLHQRSDRYRSDRGGFGNIELKAILGRDDSDYRRDDDAVARGEFIQTAEHPDMLRGDADLLMGFA